MKKNALLVWSLLFALAACNDPKKSETRSAPLSGKEKADSILNDEIKNPVTHKHLVFLNRPTIRPVYQEIEKNISAEHDGFAISLSLANRAKTTSYQNIEIEISYFSKAKALLAKEKVRIKTPIKAGDSLTTSRPIRKYKNTSYTVAIASATAKVN